MLYGNSAEELFRSLYEENQKIVYAYFMSCFRDPFTAEELSQETFEKVWRYLRENPYFIPVQRKAWIFSIVANVKNDWLRKKQRGLPYGGTLEDCRSVISDPSPYGNPEDCVEAIPIQQAFQMLDQAEQELLTYKWQGLTSLQMELILAVPASTLRSRMATVKKKFRKALENCGVNWE
ncbi:MAG: sigma-70 family RNA polymerase sigma factor [Oscillospiraceae bacterium]|jgi:RNA polymerase sigma factor (sigma-70 family)|nr:sigma-70 family RNA polymerase sigma factor [Oscillospiraceae bacterium]